MAPPQHSFPASDQRQRTPGGDVAIHGEYCSPDDKTYVPTPLVFPGSCNMTPSVHTVQAGETLWLIAKNDLGDSTLWRWLAMINGLDVNATLFAGMRLRLNPLVQDWTPIVRQPNTNANSNDVSSKDSDSKRQAVEIDNPTVVYVLGEGDTAAAKIDPDLSQFAELKPGAKRWTEIPEFGVGPFIVSAKLKGSIKIQRLGSNSKVTFTLAGLEKDADGIANEVFGHGLLDTFKARFDPTKEAGKRWSFAFGTKFQWGPADFSIEADLIEKALKISCAVKSASFEMGPYLVQPKIGVEVKIKKRNKSLPNDKKQVEPDDEDETQTHEASAAVAIIVIAVGLLIVRPVVAAAAGRLAFASAAEKVGRAIPVLLRAAPSAL